MAGIQLTALCTVTIMGMKGWVLAPPGAFVQLSCHMPDCSCVHVEYNRALSAMAVC